MYQPTGVNLVERPPVAPMNKERGNPLQATSFQS